MRKVLALLTLFFFTLLTSSTYPYDVIGGGGGTSGVAASQACPTNQYITGFDNTGALICGVPSGSTPTGYATIQAAGTPLTAQLTLNFLAPLTGVNNAGNSTTDISIPAASGTVNGYLSSTNWTTFNNKENALTFTDPVHRTTNTITCVVATGSVPGCLSAADWTTFNAKENALTFSAPISRSVNTISMAAATGSVNGYLSSTDWTTFNNKQAALSTSAAVTNQVIDSFTAPNTFHHVQLGFSNISGSVAAAQLPNPSASTLGGVESLAAVTSNWIDSISVLGVPHASQPAFTDISGTVAAGQLPNPSATTLGGVKSLAAVSSKWINAISTAGAPSATQPACADISNAGTMCTANQSAYFSVANNLGDAGGVAATMRTNLGLGTSATHPATDFESAFTPVAPLAVGSGNLSMHVADATHDGYLSSTDWNTFTNNTAVVTSVNAPLVVGTGVLSIPAASASVSGYLSSTDWSTFNNKFSNFNVSPAQSLAATNAIDCNSYIVNPVKHSTAGNVVITANPQIVAGTTAGQQCYIVGGHATQTVTISNGTGVSLPGMTTHTFKNGESMLFRWDAVGSVWVAETTAYIDDKAPVANNFVTGIVDGVVTQAQPAIADLQEGAAFGDIYTHNAIDFVDAVSQSSAPTPGQGISGKELIFDTTNAAAPIVYACGGNGQDCVNIADQGDAYSQMTDGSNAVTASGASAFKFVGAHGLTPTVSGSPDKVTYDLNSKTAGFLNSGPVTCGAATAGKMAIDDNGLLTACDYAGTPAIHYYVLGDSSGKYPVNQALALYIPSSAIVCASTGTVRYTSLAGNVLSSTQTTSAMPFPYTGHLTAVYANTYGITPSGQSLIVKLVENNSNGTVTCTVGAGASTCNDTSHSDAITAGQNFSVSVQCNGGTAAYSNGLAIIVNALQP